MAITEHELNLATQRMEAFRQQGHAVAARYDRRRVRVIVSLNTGVEVTFPPELAEGLAEAGPADLAEIEITASGLGLHWPRLDADLYVPGLLAGAFGSNRWVAAQLGAAGGRARTRAKSRAARANGRLGGRPKKHSTTR